MTEYLDFSLLTAISGEKYENMLRDEIADNTDYRWFKF